MPETDWVDGLDDVREDEEDEEQNDDGEGWLDDEEDDDDEIEIVDPLDDWEE